MDAIYDQPGAARYAAHRAVQQGVLAVIHGLDTLQPGSRVLEVGCGTASHLRAICEWDRASGCGIDRSLAMMRESQPEGRGTQEAGAHLGLAVADGMALPFCQNAFDLVFSVAVVHHLTRSGERAGLCDAYRAMASVVRAGGLVVTATDSEATIKARVPLSSHFPETVTYELARYPSEAVLRRAHRASGLEILTTEVVAQPYLLTDAAAFRARAFSCLHAISEDALARGIARLESELPLRCYSRNLVVVARKC